LGSWLAGNWNSPRPLGQDAGGQRGRQGGPAVAARGKRLLIGDAQAGGTGRGSVGRREDDRATPYGVGQERTYGGAAFKTASACALHGEGASCVGKARGTSEGTWAARIPRWPVLARGKRATAGACGSALSAVIYSECPCLTAIFSRNLNRSAQCGQQESCRSHYPLQLS
jgi:hypothetical protein